MSGKQCVVLTRSLMLAFTLALLARSHGPACAAPPPGYVLTWSDEFNGALNSVPSTTQ